MWLAIKIFRLKLAILSKDELEARIRERTQELEEARDYQTKLLDNIKAAEANLRRVITKNADSIIIVDKNEIVRFVNPAAESLVRAPRGVRRPDSRHRPRTAWPWMHRHRASHRCR